MVAPRVLQYHAVTVAPRVLQYHVVTVASRVLQYHALTVAPRVLQDHAVMVAPRVLQHHAVTVAPRVLQYHVVTVASRVVQYHAVTVASRVLQYFYKYVSVQGATVSVHTVKVYRGVEVWLHYLLASALDGGDCLGSGTGRFTLGRGHESPLNERLRGLQSLPELPGEETYFLLLPRLEPRTVQL
jgi:hypothetical protein